MRLTIDPELKTKCPRCALGLLTANVVAGETPFVLLEEMKSREAEILKLPEPRAVLDSSKILATRTGYKSLGKDPSRYRGSAEALLRRIISGKSFPQINSVVDVINLVSVECRLPIGLYDLAHVQGDIVFRVGRTGETYKGIGKYDLNLEGLPVFCDETGPHGSPTSDSERTMVTPGNAEDCRDRRFVWRKRGARDLLSKDGGPAGALCRGKRNRDHGCDLTSPTASVFARTRATLSVFRKRFARLEILPRWGAALLRPYVGNFTISERRVLRFACQQWRVISDSLSRRAVPRLTMPRQPRHVPDYAKATSVSRPAMGIRARVQRLRPFRCRH